MSDDESQINPKAHKNLLQAISSLGKVQHIRKAVRSEPQQQQDEFHLSKGKSSVASSTALPEHVSHPVGINDIVKVLKTTKKHIDVGKEFKNASKKKVLEKPLEKPAADRIKRTIGYENVQNKLERWDAIVAKNRSSETQVFPLKSETIYVNTSAHARPLQLANKSELELEMEATDAKLRDLKKERSGIKGNEKDLAKREQQLLRKKLTRDELIARRRELAYMKIREAQKSAKARLHNKIKSKKFHKLMKRQKLQEQIKEFELLQKTNPEAALEKLNALEKSRVMERASLKHKNTGAWAKNLQVRAKYDKDVRKDLAEQLQLSRQLTEKKNVSDESDDEAQADDAKMADIKEDATYDAFNPWTRSGSDGKNNLSETNEMENWRKYWLERNSNEKKLHEYKKDEENIKEESVAKSEKNEEHEPADVEVQAVNASKQSKKCVAPKVNAAAKQSEKVNNTKSKLKNKIIENGWVVEEIDDTQSTEKKNIDDIFDEQEDKIRTQLNKKLKVLKREAKRLQKTNRKAKPPKDKKMKDELKNLKDLTFKNELKRPIIDEELNNEDENVNEKSLSAELTMMSSDEPNIKSATTTTAAQTIDAIDPNKLATVKLKQRLNTFNHMNDALGGDDVAMDEEMSGDEQNAQQQMTISEAFEDDDIIADFSKDKEKDSELKNTEIQLSMPGWGSWAGAGISAEQEKVNRNKRLILKLAKEEKRRDDSKNELYINQNVSKQLRTHLVSDLPFPFTSLQDYEASIRAPIGRNFVPETAFRMLTRPAVITHKGQIIEPMDESELIKRPRRLRKIVDKRIARAATAAAS